MAHDLDVLAGNALRQQSLEEAAHTGDKLVGGLARVTGEQQLVRTSLGQQALDEVEGEVKINDPVLHTGPRDTRSLGELNGSAQIHHLQNLIFGSDGQFLGDMVNLDVDVQAFLLYVLQNVKFLSVGTVAGSQTSTHSP